MYCYCIVIILITDYCIGIVLVSKSRYWSTLLKVIIKQSQKMLVKISSDLFSCISRLSVIHEHDDYNLLGWANLPADASNHFHSKIQAPIKMETFPITLRMVGSIIFLSLVQTNWGSHGQQLYHKIRCSSRK
jgi:hypothetical protein